jgi:hypothetical protein
VSYFQPLGPTHIIHPGMWTHVDLGASARAGEVVEPMSRDLGWGRSLSRWPLR